MLTLLIVEQPTLVTDAKLLKPLKTHRLLGLMDRIKTLTFSKSKRLVAVVCESAIPYWGRYPVPLNYEQVASEHFINEQFHDDFVSLNNRVRKSVYVQIKDGWDSGVGPKLLEFWLQEFEADEYDLQRPLPWCDDSEDRRDS